MCSSDLRSPAIEIARAELRGHLSRELAGRDVQVDSLVEDIIEYVARTQAILREAVATQAEINRFLGRAAPKRPFAAGDMDVHNLLQGAESRRLPYLLDELSAAFGLEFRIDANSVEITSLSTGAHGALDHSISAGSSPVEKAASHDARSWSQA